MKKGRIYRVIFLDHCEGGTRPMQFELIGRCTKVLAHSVTITCWGYLKGGYHDGNTNHFTLVTSTIQKFEELAAI